MKLSKFEGPIELFNRFYPPLSLHLHPYKTLAQARTVMRRRMIGIRVLIVKTSGPSQFQRGPATPADPIWMREARRQMGILEVPGSKSNPTILGWAKALGGWVANFYKDDDTPWCGLFAAHCIGLTLPAEKLPTNYLSALAWADFGIQCEPVIGAVLVFRRNGGGHVGFYAGENDDSYVVLGGNQGNSVKLSNVEKRRCIGIRWPKTGGAQIGGRVNSTPAGGLSAMRQRLSAAKPGYTLSRRQLWFSFWLAWLTIGAIVACGLMGAPSAVEFAPIVIPSMIMLIAAMLGIHRFAGAMDYRSSIVLGPDLAPDDARADRQGEIQ